MPPHQVLALFDGLLFGTVSYSESLVKENSYFSLCEVIVTVQAYTVPFQNLDTVSQ